MSTAGKTSPRSPEVVLVIRAVSPKLPADGVYAVGRNGSPELAASDAARRQSSRPRQEVASLRLGMEVRNVTPVPAAARQSSPDSGV